MISKAAKAMNHRPVRRWMVKAFVDVHFLVVVEEWSRATIVLWYAYVREFLL